MLVLPERNPKTSSPRLQLLVLVVAFVLFIISGLLGVFSGISYAQSKATYNGANLITQALDYFYKDNGVYPTQDQFVNNAVLKLYYLSDMPRPFDINGSCSNHQNFVYTQQNQGQYKLQFCLTSSVAGFPAGINTITNSPQ